MKTLRTIEASLLRGASYLRTVWSTAASVLTAPAREGPYGVVMNPPALIDSRTWRVSWYSDEDDPTFYVYRDGALLTITKATEILVAADFGESLVIEVLSDPDTLPITAYPGRLTLCWYASTGASHYRIEEYVGSEWTFRKRLDDRGEGYFKWRTRFLEDSTEHQFRITPVGTNGEAGAPRTLTCLMVRHPDVPAVDYVYDDQSAVVTISAA